MSLTIEKLDECRGYLVSQGFNLPNDLGGNLTVDHVKSFSELTGLSESVLTDDSVSLLDTCDLLYEHSLHAHALDQMAHEAYNISKDHGFWEDQDPKNPFVQATKLALIHSEVSEALEAIRRKEGDDRLTEELADVIIRCFDLVGALGLDLGHTLKRKMAKNKTRSHKHGGKVL